MKHTVQVTIERYDHKFIVRNNHGRSWEYINKQAHSHDHTVNNSMADIAGAMLTATIASSLEELSSPKIEFTLSVNYK